MALINHRAREIHFKIVYYGPGLGGKTTNLKLLHDKLPPERRGKLLSIATDHERTLFFDFLPIDLGQVNGFTTRIHLYTVPGQVYYKLSRRAVLQGVDGIVFVADSHPAREQANRDSLADLSAHLETLGLQRANVQRLPRVYQYNKRDLPSAMPMERMRAALNPEGAPEFGAVARDGAGVNETLRTICKAVLARLSQGATGPAPAATPPGAARPPAAPAHGMPPAPAPRPVPPAARRVAPPGARPIARPMPPAGARPAPPAAGRPTATRPMAPAAAAATPPRPAPSHPVPPKPLPPRQP